MMGMWVANKIEWDVSSTKIHSSCFFANQVFFFLCKFYRKIKEKQEQNKRTMVPPLREV